MSTVKGWVVVVVFCALMLCGCQPETKRRQIGIIQHAPATWADDVRHGFEEALAASKYKEGTDYEIIYQAGAGEQDSLFRIARSFMSRRVDIIFAISTQAAQAAVRASEGEVPVLFGAITDPVEAGLVRSLTLPGTGATGTSDQWPVREQLLLFRDLDANFARLGVLHNPGEDNSVSNMRVVRRVVTDLGWDLREYPVSSTTDVLRAAESAAAEVDGIYIPASNTVLEATESVVKVGVANGLPVIAGVANSVAKGAHATYSVSYYDIGKINAEQAIEILWNHKSPNDLPVRVPDKYDLIINLKTIHQAGLTVPDIWMEKAVEIFN